MAEPYRFIAAPEDAEHRHHDDQRLRNSMDIAAGLLLPGRAVTAGGTSASWVVA